MTNIKRAQQVIQELIGIGVSEFCVCAGARNAPLIEVLAAAKQVKVWSGFEERSMAFFALGRAKRLQQAVAVITTSGTALAETLPAVIEAHASQVPLVVVSADRPRTHRLSGSPQTMPQLDILKTFVEKVYDLESEDVCDLSDWGRGTACRALTLPLHINICFGEPLIDGPVCHSERSEESRSYTGPFVNTQGDKLLQDDIKVFLSRCHKPVVLVGELLFEERMAVLKFLLAFNAPVYAEALSGLRGHVKLEALELRSGEKILSRAEFDGVLRLGGVPTTRFWRDLEEKFRDMLVLSVTRVAASGLARPSKHMCGKLSDILQPASFQDVLAVCSDYSAVFEHDQRESKRLREILQQFPRSEPGLLFQLQNLIAPQSTLYIGNSLPIREWDLVSDKSCQRTFANRGMNGIDGQLSTFFGVAEKGEEAWGIFGDLTTLYDLSSGWFAQKRPELTLRIVIINNGGGKIFSRVFGNELYENQHQLRFADWAKMWGLNYQAWHEIPAQPDFAQQQVIELLPDAEQTEKFWKAYDEMWKR